MAPYIDEIFNEIPPIASSILDVGCGKGTVAALIKTMATIWPEKCYIIGIDISAYLLNFAKRYYDDVIQAHASFLPFRDKTFDAVISVEVLEHLTKREGYRMLAEIERITRKKIIITTPSHWVDMDKGLSLFDKRVRELESL